MGQVTAGKDHFAGVIHRLLATLGDLIFPTRSDTTANNCARLARELDVVADWGALADPLPA